MSIERSRVSEFLAFLDSVPDIDSYRYLDKKGNFRITNEWLCGTFAGRGFSGETPSEAASQLMEYFDRHINHKSMVGDSVTNSGWPDLKKVAEYLELETNPA